MHAPCPRTGVGAAALAGGAVAAVLDVAGDGVALHAPRLGALPERLVVAVHHQARGGEAVVVGVRVLRVDVEPAADGVQRGVVLGRCVFGYVYVFVC